MTIRERKINLNDSYEIFKWRNDPFSKQMSLTKNDITWEDHSIWMQAVINNHNNVVYIALYDENNKIGICRFFEDIEFKIKVSINLNPNFRGRHLSSKVLSLCVNDFRTNSARPLHAIIDKSNLRSLSIFKKCNFILTQEDNDYMHLTLPNSKDTLEDKLKLIDEIEKIRSANNINWMDLLRLSFSKAPEETKLLIRKINSDDNKISELFAKLGE